MTNTAALYVLFIGLIKFVIIENDVREVASKLAYNTKEPLMYFNVQVLLTKVVLS